MPFNDGKYCGLMCNGEIAISQITEEHLDEALDVLDHSFFINENVCIGSQINLPENHQARTELRGLCKIVAKDGVSFMARHIPTNKIVSVAFNKLQFTGDDDCFFVKFRNECCKSPNSISLMNYMIDMENQIDVFKLFGIDCLLELMFLGTIPEFEKKKIGRTLCKYSIELAKDLQNGIITDNLNLELNDKRPKAVAALFTSVYSQKIGDALEFKILNTVPFINYKFNGKTFADRIGPNHPDSKLVVLML